MEATTSARPSAGRIPDDPVAFIAAAERGINERDLDATAGAYAPAAVLESIADGARERFCGTEEIRRAWAAYLDGMDRTGFRLGKTLVAAADGVVVNTWQSDFRGRKRGGGIEVWRFDAQGQVGEHTMYTFFEIRSSTDLLQRVRLLLTQPRLAVAFLRATLRAR